MILVQNLVVLGVENWFANCRTRIGYRIFGDERYPGRAARVDLLIRVVVEQEKYQWSRPEKGYNPP